MSRTDVAFPRSSTVYVIVSALAAHRERWCLFILTELGYSDDMTILSIFSSAFDLTEASSHGLEEIILRYSCFKFVVIDSTVFLLISG